MHQAWSWCVDAQRDSGWTVGDEIYPQHLQRRERHWLPKRGSAQDRGNRTDCCCNLEANELQDVVVDRATAANCIDDRGEIVVGQHHVAGFFSDFGTGDSHRHTNVGSTKCSGIVHAITCHCHDFAIRT